MLKALKILVQLKKGYDAGEKISGIKRHLGLDIQGISPVIHTTTADITYREAA
jgi:hypothetical protein